jgi:hypothetical protein
VIKELGRKHQTGVSPRPSIRDQPNLRVEKSPRIVYVHGELKYSKGTHNFELSAEGTYPKLACGNPWRFSYFDALWRLGEIRKMKAPKVRQKCSVSLDARATQLEVSTERYDQFVQQRLLQT